MKQNQRFSNNRKRARDKRAVPMPELAPAERLRGFSEPACGYTEAMAVDEARRCHACQGASAKCVRSCPIGINIPKFVAQVAEGKFQEAYQTIRKENPLPGICGRICPQEELCQPQCVAAAGGEAISIAHLERFVGDRQRSQVASRSTRPVVGDAPRVAIVGSGPAGLTCAADLARSGCLVTIFEKQGGAGGVLAYGIPEFRLPKEMVAAEIEAICRGGVTVQTHSPIHDVAALRKILGENGFRAAFVGSWADLPPFKDLPGIELKGVSSAHEFLARVSRARMNAPAANSEPAAACEHVVVVGGGSEAIDCARAALRLGAAEVTVICRRSLQELSARACDLEYARQEGVQFLPFSVPVRLIGNETDFLRRVECAEADPHASDQPERPCPAAKPGSEFQLPADTFVFAVGRGPGPEWANTVHGLETDDEHGDILGADVRRTVIPGVFAGGEMIAGGSVTGAMRCGRAAARSIQRYLGTL